MHHRKISRPRAPHLALTIGMLLILGVLAGCGHSAAAGSTSSSGSGKGDAPVKFSQCMRQHGIDFPDPQSNGNGGFSLQIRPGSGPGRINPDDPKFKQAQDACKSYLPNGGQMSPDQQAQFQQNALAFARCMRAHGINIPDPQTSGGGVKIQGNGINFDDPKFQQAQQACSRYLGVPGSMRGSSSSTGG